MNPDTYAQCVLIIVSSGPSTPVRCVASFHTATLLTRMDAEVAPSLSGGGVQLARRAVADQLCALDGGEPLRHLICQVREAGARLPMCRQSGMDIGESEPIEELDEISNGGELAWLILGPERVLIL